MKKKFFTLFMPFMVAAAIVNAQSGSSYNGNGASGFGNNNNTGGGVGSSNLTISDNSTTINFSLSTSGLNGNVLVLYFDTKSGGFTNTSTFTDHADNGRTAISGTNGNTRTIATFSTGTGGFAADYAISIEQGSFAGIFELKAGMSHTFLNSANLSSTNNSGNAVLTFSVNKSDFGIFNGAGFSFVGTLISSSAYRSNETIGASSTTPGSESPSPGVNAGYTGSTSFSGANNGVNTYAFSVLPLKLVSFSGKNSNNSVVLNWVTNNESGVRNFVVEGSTNAVEWRNLATVAAKNTAKAEYSQTLTVAGNTFYRLQMVDKDGKTTYSTVINLKSADHSIKLITNPVVGAVRLSINADAAKYTTTLYSMDGKAIATTSYSHPGGVSTYEMPLSNVAKGNYLLKITGATETKSFNVMVQ